MKVIIDTCAWSQFLRQGRSLCDLVAQEVARLARAGAVEMLGPIRQELLSGAQPDERFGQLRDYLRFYPNLLLGQEDDEIAAEYYNQLRRHGLAGTGTDLIICAAAVRRGLKIFTTDGDFLQYARLLPIKLHRAGGRI